MTAPLTGFDLCRAVMDVQDISGPEASVLLVLALMANDDAQCWPPMHDNGDAKGLISRCKHSERTIQRAVQRLVDLGHISRRQLRHGVVYTIHPRLDIPTPATVAGVRATGDSVTPATQAPRGASVAPKQPVTTRPKDADASSGSERGSKGTRMEHDWVPTKALPDDVSAIVDGWPPGRRTRTLEEFRDHWIARAGKDATKSDWERTWWNRLRAIIDRDEQGERRSRSRQRGGGWARDPRFAGQEPASLDD